MDGDGSSSSAERTLWTVWSYITEAVNRFIRTVSTNISDNTNSVEETPVDSERVDDSAPAGGDAGGRVGAEEPPLPPPAAPPLLSSSRPLVAWEFCTTEIDLGAEENAQRQVQPSGGHRRKASEKSEGAAGEREDGGRPIADGDEREESGERGDGEEHANTRWLKLTGDAMSDDVEESEREAGAAAETERAVTPEDPREMDETTRKIQGKEHEGEKDLQSEDIEVKICPITDLSVEEEDEVHEAESTVTHGEVEDGDGVPAIVSAAGFTTPHVELQTAHHNRGVESESSESDDVEKANEEKAGAVREEENAKDHGTIEREDAVETLAGGSERGDVLTEDVPRGEEVAEAEPRDAGAVDAARSADVQTKTRQVGGGGTESVAVKSDGTMAESSAGEEPFDKDRVEEEERPFGEEGSKESFMEMSGSLNSEEPEGETVQETAAAIKDIPTGIFEGRLVVSELNFPTREETQTGVPEYNNVPDENTTQAFLEEGDCEGSVLPEEVWSKEPEGLQNSGRATQVFLEEGDCEGSVRPEEVGSKEPEGLQNSGCATGAGYLVAVEDMEEEQDIMRDVEKSFDAGLPPETEKPLEGVTRESEQLFEEEEGEFLVDCMKTGIDHSEKEFETHVGPTDEINKAANEPPDGLEEILVDLQIDEGSCDPKAADAAEDGCGTTGASATEETFLKAEEQTMTETSSCQVGQLTSEQNRNMAPSLLEDVTEHEFLKRHDETEDELLEDVEMQEARADVEETGGEVEQVVAEDEMESQNEMGVSHLQVEDLAEFEWSPLVESPEKRHLQPDEALEIGEETSTDSEAPDESKTAECRAEDFTSKPGAEEESCAEGTVGSSSGRQGVIDDDVLDLWLQAASPENDDGVQQQVDPRTGQIIEPYEEEQGDVSSLQTEKDVDQLVESNSRESDLEGHTETSSSAVETGFRGLYDTLAIVSESADVSELSAQQPNCDWRDMLGEEAAETGKTYLEEKEASAGTGFHRDSGVPSPEARHLDQGSAETQTGSWNEMDAEASDRKDGGEDEAQSQTERSCLYQFEKTQTEDGPPETAASGSPGEGSEPGRSRSGSEASLEDETVPMESRSQSDVCSDSEMKLSSVDRPQPGWNEGVAESSVGPNVTDGAGHPTTTSEDQMEVESSALDFTAQRSRISVKNPRVRPPKDSRSLLNMPSLDPTPSQQVSAKVPVGGPLGGLGFGVKLPGLGGGFPVLKKTKRVVRDENSPETISEEKKPEERSDTEGDTQHKPKWTPPRHPGFGNPLMSELKTKLKKTTKE
ncbi:uncharacterized protein si:ch211-136m16.8 [Pungitius pungitius]|uniref:uncharacterized protein si:ch211-136m16.8 n=1 Tax=Pungitius pungitius TaxID=134920 RepID=UPI002E114B60